MTKDNFPPSYIIDGYTEINFMSALIRGFKILGDLLEKDPKAVHYVNDNDQYDFASTYAMSPYGAFMVRMGYIFPVCLYHMNSKEFKRQAPFLYNILDNTLLGMPDMNVYPESFFQYDKDGSTFKKMRFPREKSQK